MEKVRDEKIELEIINSSVELILLARIFLENLPQQDIDYKMQRLGLEFDHRSFLKRYFDLKRKFEEYVEQLAAVQLYAMQKRLDSVFFKHWLEADGVNQEMLQFILGCGHFGLDITASDYFGDSNFDVFKEDNVTLPNSIHPTKRMYHHVIYNLSNLIDGSNNVEPWNLSLNKLILPPVNKEPNSKQLIVISNRLVADRISCITEGISGALTGSVNSSFVPYRFTIHRKSVLSDGTVPIHLLDKTRETKEYVKRLVAMSNRVVQGLKQYD